MRLLLAALFSSPSLRRFRLAGPGLATRARLPSAALDTGLDRSVFERTCQVAAVAVEAESCSLVMDALRPHLLRLRGVASVRSEGRRRLVLLGASTPLPAALERELQGVMRRLGGTLQECSVTVGYEQLTAAEVLRQLLPDGVEVPTAFEQVGHVAHVNLREEQLPYKALIGEVLLDKSAPQVRTVVNKLAAITDEFRVFPMEVLAGEESLETSVRENGATFRLDYRTVYWNSRLETERRRRHRRVVHQLLRPDDVVCDMMAGVGPFAVPAALRGCRVYANDLNPESARWLRTNVEANRVADRVLVSQRDARAFVRALLAPPPLAPPPPAPPLAPPPLAPPPPSPPPPSSPPPSRVRPPADSPAGAPAGLHFGPFGHVVMNLPASALEFLDVFVGAFDRSRWPAPLPRCHCYCFSTAGDPAADAIGRAEAVLGCALPDAEATVVRDVSPSKVMLCLSFQLPPVAWATEPGMDSSRGLDQR